MNPVRKNIEWREMIPARKRFSNGMNRILISLLLIFSSFLPSVTSAQDSQDNLSSPTTSGLPEVKVEALVDKSQITIGEKVTYTIRIDAQKDWQVEFPRYIDNLGGFVVRDFGYSEPKKLGKGRWRQEGWYTLDTYTTGSYVIPLLTLQTKGPDGKEVEIKTPQIFVEVKSVVKEGEVAENIRDIKLPLRLAADYHRFIYIGMGTIFFCFLGILGFWWWKRRHRKAKVPPPRPAHLIALEELERIQAMNLIEKKIVKEYYYLVSMCLRHYLENRFDLKAPEQTTEEFLEEIVEKNILDARHKALLRDFLTHCDLVKFSKYTPDMREISNIYIITKDFVEQTKKPIQENSTDSKIEKEKI